MRLLAQPDVLRSAGFAAGISALLCYPRLAASQSHVEMLWFSVLALLWCQFVLWAFVFAWEPAYGTAKTLAVRWEPRNWAILGVGATLIGAYQFFLIDPGYREIAPNEFPHTFNAWWRQVFFTIGFQELFLCYGPLAFFARLARDEKWVLALTIGLNVFMATVKLYTLPESPGALTMTAIVLHRIVITYVAVRLYRWSGICAVSLLVLLTQSRHLLQLDL